MGDISPYELYRFRAKQKMNWFNNEEYVCFVNVFNFMIPFPLPKKEIVRVSFTHYIIYFIKLFRFTVFLCFF